MIRSATIYLVAVLVAGAVLAGDATFVGVHRKAAWCFDQRGFGADQSDKWRPCKKKEYDTLRIERRSADSYKVEFSFVQFATTAGQCELAGVFELKGSKLLVSDLDAGLKAEGCVMEIEIMPHEFKFHDPTNSCAREHCGRNQSIDGAVFPRRQSK